MIVRAIAIAVLLWALGFAAFAVAMPGAAEARRRTDGIVVVTGAPGRVPRGLTLLRAGAARRMLVSGADRRVRPDDLAAEYRVPAALVRCCVDLGRESVDTRSNAEESAAWMAQHRYRSVRLVTSDWHMARARFELARTLPAGVTLIADAVPGEPGLWSLMTEYNKFLLRRIAAPLGL